MPLCSAALELIARCANESPDEFLAWLDGGLLRSATASGPLFNAFPKHLLEFLEAELVALPRSVLPLMIDAVDLAARTGRHVEFSAPTVDPADEEEFRQGKKVRIELEYDQEKISMKLYHLGAEDQAEWYAQSDLQSPAFSHMFRRPRGR